MNRLFLLLALVPSLALAQSGIGVKDNDTTRVTEVDANNNLRVSQGPSTRATYTVSMGAQATTAAMTLSIEAGAAAGQGLRLAGFCISTSVATAAAKVDVVIQRRTTASSVGTACVAEGTAVGVCNVSKHDPAGANFPGIARNGGTPGTAGAVLWQTGFTVGELGAGAADPNGQPTFCYEFPLGSQAPSVAVGIANGLTINVSAAGAGGLASGAINAIVVVE